jgi:hypothetical protein
MFWLLAFGCPGTDETTPPKMVENRGSEPISIYVDGIVELAFQVDPGETQRTALIPDRLGCTTQAMVAKTLDGVEVDRIEPPFCDGETWVIEES